MLSENNFIGGRTHTSSPPSYGSRAPASKGLESMPRVVVQPKCPIVCWAEAPSKSGIATNNEACTGIGVVFN